MRPKLAPFVKFEFLEACQINGNIQVVSAPARTPGPRQSRPANKGLCPKNHRRLPDKKGTSWGAQQLHLSLCAPSTSAWRLRAEVVLGRTLKSSARQGAGVFTRPPPARAAPQPAAKPRSRSTGDLFDRPNYGPLCRPNVRSSVVPVALAGGVFKQNDKDLGRTHMREQVSESGVPSRGLGPSGGQLGPAGCFVSPPASTCELRTRNN